VETIGCSFTRTGLDFKAAMAFVRETRQRRRARHELSGMPMAGPANSQDQVSQVSQDIQDPELSQGGLYTSTLFVSAVSCFPSFGKPTEAFHNLISWDSVEGY
jgi:hypothetical protein